MMALSPESSFSAPHIENENDADSSNVASMVESTPPTTVADTASLHSDVSKHDVITVDVTLPSPVAHEHDREHDHDEHTTPELTPAATPAVATPAITPAVTPAPDDDASASRGRRSRGGPAPVYNLAKLSGTDGHGKRRSKGDIVSNRRRRKTLGATTTAELSRAAEAASTPTESVSAAGATIDALNLSWSPKPAASPSTRTQARESPRARRPAVRLSSSSLKLSAAKTKSPASSIKAKAKAAIAKPVIKAVAKPTIKAPDKPAAPAKKLPRELRRLQDTKEFAHIDEQPIIYTVWAKGKYINPKEAKEDTPASKRVKRDQEPEEQGVKESSEPVIDLKKRRVKKYLDKGLYAGQETPADITWGLTPAEKKSLSQIPELKPSGRQSKIMPPPMFNGLRTLIAGRDFKLPFQICSPLPPGQPKPDEWKKMTKSTFQPGPCPVSIPSSLTVYRSIRG